MIYKDYKIEIRGTHALFDIKQTGSGPVPAALKGGFTTVELAKTHIDSYLRQKGKVNAKSKRTSIN